MLRCRRECGDSRPAPSPLLPCGTEAADLSGDSLLLEPDAGATGGGGLSPAVRSLELARVLAETGRLTLRASGSCMYPQVRPGDRLIVSPATAEQIAPGQIVVFRRGDSLFGHRAIASGEDDRGPYVETRPDRAPSGSDGPSRDRDILGVVTVIARGSRRIAPDPVRARGTWARGRAALGVKVRDFKDGMRASTRAAVARAQRTSAYRLTAGPVLVRAARPLRWEALVPFGTSKNGAAPFLRKLGDAELGALRLDVSTGNDCILRLLSRGRPAGSVSLVRLPAACPFAGWWVQRVFVRTRYCGLGLEQMLLAKARELLDASGAVLNGGERWTANTRG